jgi:hypothetical protein
MKFGRKRRGKSTVENYPFLKKKKKKKKKY